MMDDVLDTPEGRALVDVTDDRLIDAVAATNELHRPFYDRNHEVWWCVTCTLSMPTESDAIRHQAEQVVARLGIEWVGQRQQLEPGHTGGFPLFRVRVLESPPVSRSTGTEASDG